MDAFNSNTSQRFRSLGLEHNGSLVSCDMNILVENMAAWITPCWQVSDSRLK
ncbi:MAG: hypothetical protein M0022_02310 [Desulfobacteraceae bacterium]|nr:hypothetical protein [Desulfobacteraceae bacterium]